MKTLGIIRLKVRKLLRLDNLMDKFNLSIEIILDMQEMVQDMEKKISVLWRDRDNLLIENEKLIKENKELKKLLKEKNAEINYLRKKNDANELLLKDLLLEFQEADRKCRIKNMELQERFLETLNKTKDDEIRLLKEELNRLRKENEELKKIKPDNSYMCKNDSYIDVDTIDVRV